MGVRGGCWVHATPLKGNSDSPQSVHYVDQLWKGPPRAAGALTGWVGPWARR